MKINNLTKNKNGSYELLIDEEKINLDEDTIVKFRLLKNKELNESELSNILKENELNKLANKILDYRLKYSKSINECIRHFETKDILKDNILLAIDILETKKLIDDNILAFNIASSLARNSNGYYLIKEKLKLKLFDDEIITEVLSKLDSDDILLGKEKLVKKLEKKYQKDDEKTRNLKIKKQLYQHGYKI